jgi:ubiquinone/menaquinone biosynthesis C-methylase UbiE
LNTKIKQYWEERAKENITSPEATTNDIYLRELEISSLVKEITNTGISNGTILDAGCGDGYSTLRVAKELPDFKFVGVDYSENMIGIAMRRCDEKQGPLPVEFKVGDVENLNLLFPNMSFDIVITDRCLINLDSPNRQYNAINQIHKLLKPSGYYLAIENFLAGQKNLTDLRQSVGLPEIPVRWHNLFFDEVEFMERMIKMFNTVSIVNFSSSYYFATRVIYSSMCQMRHERPDYQHDIHKLSINLPVIGDCSPIKMAILQK